MIHRIGILGWGSLLWEDSTEFDRWHSAWQLDGPTVPLEFSRISATRAGALAMAIDKVHGAAVTVAWADSRRLNREDALSDLRSRERTSIDNIGWVSVLEDQGGGRDRDLSAAIRAWARRRTLDCVIWTDLPSNFEAETKERFSVPNALAYLNGLGSEGRIRAVEYLRRAPSFVRTPLRAAFDARQSRALDESGES